MTELNVISEQKVLEKQFKIYGTVENPLFLAKDVANWIEHSKPDVMLKSIDSDEKVKVNNVYVDGRTGGNGVWFLTEDGLYEVLMLSRKPVAKQFKKEVKAILKQIRQTGGYVQEDREPEFIDKYFPSFNDQVKLAMVQDLLTQNKQYKQEIAKLTPKATAYEDLMSTKGYIKFIDLAQSMQIGRTTLLGYLRKKKVITKQSNFNVPYGRFNKNNYFRVVHGKDDYGRYQCVTLVSPKGLHYIYKLIKKDGLLDEFDMSPLLQLATSAKEVA